MGGSKLHLTFLLTLSLHCQSKSIYYEQASSILRCYLGPSSLRTLGRVKQAIAIARVFAWHPRPFGCLQHYRGVSRLCLGRYYGFACTRGASHAPVAVQVAVLRITLVVALCTRLAPFLMYRGIKLLW